MTGAPFTIVKKSNYTVHPAPYPCEVPGFLDFNSKLFNAALFASPLALTFWLGLPLYYYPVVLALTIVPSYVAFMWTYSILKNNEFGQKSAKKKGAGLKMSDYMTFNDPQLSGYLNSRIPMETFFEAYFDGKIDIKGDMLDMLESRHEWASFQFTFGHLKFLLKNFIPEVTFHSRNQDETQVRDHYDRGNDFYDAFLGPMMVYTSGIIGDSQKRETLEKLQENKLNLVCNKIQLKAGEHMLDIGCGWGTLLAHAAKSFGAQVTGVTLAREQTEFGLKRAKDYGVEDKVRILCHDYRDIPRSDASNGQKYNKITCLEMAEHVGVRRFNTFLLQVSELLEDDGIFYMQVAGLRRCWQFEDLIWGLFMNKYIFPGADASTPLFWYVNQLEYAGFEVQSVDTVGVHYSATLERWYQNWMKPENKEKISAKYGIKLWRVWEFFLAWSTIISRQGSATCYQIVCHKNKNAFNRASLISGYGQKRLNVS